MDVDYKVKLEVFEGPLDLLLYLIKQDEIDIYDISLERITSQYLEYLQAFKELNVELAGEFIVMAANLIYLKSRSLLPRDQQPPEEDAGEEDPRSDSYIASEDTDKDLISQTVYDDDGRVRYTVDVMGAGDVERFLEIIGAAGERKTRTHADLVRPLEAQHTRNTNRDVIPREAWRSIVRRRSSFRPVR